MNELMIKNVAHMVGNMKDTMSSLEIAKLTGKDHGNVMRDIRQFLEAIGGVASDFESTYIDSQGKERPMVRNSKKLVYGVGVKGDGATWVNGKPTQAYRTWYNMLVRCYSPRYHKLRPTYIGCYVCKEWLYFPTFKEWFDANYVEGWQLDKDLLVKGNKIYSPDTCIFVPSQINSLFTDHGRARGKYPIGVYLHKKSGKFEAYVTIDGKNQHLGLFDDPNEAHRAYLAAKKANVVRMANEWKEKIPTKLYEALIRKAEDL